MKKAPLLALLNRYQTKYPADEHAENTFRFLQNAHHYWQAEQTTGHITASAWVLNQDKNQVLLTHHLKLNQWFQLGGHIETQDENIHHACLREAREESGLESLELLSEEIFDIDVHLIPESKKGFPAHYHYDIRMLLTANDQEPIAFDPNESNNVRWFHLDEVRQLSESSLQRMLSKTEIENINGKNH